MFGIFLSPESFSVLKTFDLKTANWVDLFLKFTRIYWNTHTHTHERTHARMRSGAWSFRNTAPALWNRLPDKLHQTTSPPPLPRPFPSSLPRATMEFSCTESGCVLQVNIDMALAIRDWGQLCRVRDYDCIVNQFWKDFVREREREREREQQRNAILLLWMIILINNFYRKPLTTGKEMFAWSRCFSCLLLIRVAESAEAETTELAEWQSAMARHWYDNVWMKMLPHWGQTWHSQWERIAVIEVSNV